MRKSSSVAKTIRPRQFGPATLGETLLLRTILKSIPFTALLTAPLMVRPAAAKDGALQMVSIDVEGGGGTLFVTPDGKSLLIDTGNPDDSRATGSHPSSERIAAAAAALGVKKIDYLITTHYHVD